MSSLVEYRCWYRSHSIVPTIVISFLRSLGSPPGRDSAPCRSWISLIKTSMSFLSQRSVVRTAMLSFHQSVSGIATLMSSSKVKLANTTDSLNRTRGRRGSLRSSGEWIARYRSRASCSCSERSRKARLRTAAVVGLYGVSSNSIRRFGFSANAIQTSGRIGKSCVNLRCCSGLP